MKKFLHTAVAATVLLLATGAHAAPIASTTDASLQNATVINFESMADSSALSYDAGVVTFKSLTGSPLSIMFHNGPFGSTGQTLNNTFGNAFEAVFDGTVSAFGITSGAVNVPWTYTAYGVNNNILEVLSLNDSCCSGFFHGIKADGIKRVTFTPSSTDWVVFDDIRFSATQVPEPGSLALLGLTLAAFAASRRKKA